MNLQNNTQDLNEISFHLGLALEPSLYLGEGIFNNKIKREVK